VTIKPEDMQGETGPILDLPTYKVKDHTRLLRWGNVRTVVKSYDDGWGRNSDNEYRVLLRADLTIGDFALAQKIARAFVDYINGECQNLALEDE
jgi:hypothetical protein